MMETESCLHRGRRYLRATDSSNKKSPNLLRFFKLYVFSHDGIIFFAYDPLSCVDPVLLCIVAEGTFGTS